MVVTGNETYETVLTSIFSFRNSKQFVSVPESISMNSFTSVHSKDILNLAAQAPVACLMTVFLPTREGLKIPTPQAL